MKIYKNPNEQEFKEITEAVEANDGYCPCAATKEEDTKCPCRSFRETDVTDFCHCGRFYKIPDFETLALIGDITEENLFDQWVQVLNKQNFIVLPVGYDAYNFYHNSAEYSALCRTKIHKADAVFVLDDNTDWIIDMEAWSEAIGKKILHRSDLK